MPMMPMARVAVLLWALCTTSAAAQDSTSRALLRLEDEWPAALVRRDARVFERLLADGFIYTEDDRTVGRAAVMRDLVQGTDTVTSAHNEGMEVHPFGATAIVTGWLVMQGHGAGGRFDRRYRFTDVWMRRGGAWRIVAAHDYLVPSRAR
jgi:ketosteroid isomerase-like protein